MDEDEDPVGDYLSSEEGKKAFAEQVKKDTWGNGQPMVYMDKKGDIVKHWEDGKIEILKEGSRDMKILLGAIENPPEPNEKLKEAARNYKKNKGDE